MDFSRSGVWPMNEEMIWRRMARMGLQTSILSDAHPVWCRAQPDNQSALFTMSKEATPKAKQIVKGHRPFS
jgi:hypothetical protein